MIGAIAGDIIGSIYEHDPIKTKDFPLFHPQCCFTDDTVLTIAIAKAILDDRNYFKAVREIGRKYPYVGYGGSFIHWLRSTAPKPYNSWGNGSAMRVSPVGFAFDDADSVLEEARRSAEVTHNHPEGIKGAEAVAGAIFLARSGESKQRIKAFVSSSFDYDLDRRLDDIRPAYHFKISCQESVPESITAFMESEDFEEAVRNAVSLGGDADTMACIAGGIAQAFYKEIPDR